MPFGNCLVLQLLVAAVAEGSETLFYTFLASLLSFIFVVFLCAKNIISPKK